jgi:hypothetical protein
MKNTPNYTNAIKRRVDTSAPLAWLDVDNNFQYPNTWTTSKSYKQGMVTLWNDYLGIPNNSTGEMSFWLCTSDHTSNNSNPPGGVSSYWERVSSVPFTSLSGTANYLTKWNDSTSLTSSTIYDYLTNIGIGVTGAAINAKLHITNTGSLYSFLVEDSITPDSTPFVINNNGNVAIGTTFTAIKGQERKLVVNGPSFFNGSFTLSDSLTGNSINDFVINKTYNDWRINVENGDNDQVTFYLSTGVENHIIMGAATGAYNNMILGAGGDVCIEGNSFNSNTNYNEFNYSVGIGKFPNTYLLEVNDYILGTGFKTPTGASNQYLMANGSVLTRTIVGATLSAASWSSNSLTVTVSGVTTSNLVTISAPSDRTQFTAYAVAGISCTAQGTNSLTFVCDSTPNIDIRINVKIES